MSKRRLIGPTIITLVMCGLWTDYIFFADSPWSIVGFLSKIITVFAAIFGPAFNPEFYGWVKDLTVPVLMVVLAIVLLSLSIARAKTAMNDATPNPEAPLPRAAPKPASVPKTTVAPDRAPVILPRNPRQHGLLAKSIFSFALVSVLFSVAVYLIAYQYMYSVTDKNIKNRADTMALGTADLTAQRFAAGNLQELTAVVDKYAPIREVAYVYVEDADGRILAHVPSDLPRNLNRDFPRSAEQAIHGIEVQYRGVAVYEIAKRIGGSKAGFVHLGIWRTAVDEETRLALVPIAAAIFAVLVGTIAMFVYIIRCVNRPFLQLVDHAGRISKGELVVPLELKRPDEIGEIARSLERMRSSLRAVVTRLDQSQRSKQSGL